MHRLTGLCLAHPRAAVALLALSTALLAAGLPGLERAYGFRVLIGDDHPIVRDLDDLIHQFGGGYPIRIAWECGPGLPCAEALDQSSLEMANAIGSELRSFRGIQGVWGPHDAPLMIATRRGFETRNLVERGEVVDDRAELASMALSDPLWVGELVSADGRVASIAMQASDTRPSTDVAIVDEVERLLAPYQAAGLEFALEGITFASVVSGRELADSMLSVVPLTALVVAAVAYLLMGSLRLVLAVVTMLALALVWTFGTMAWLGFPRDAIHEVLAPLILLVGVCDAMHLLSRFAAQPATAPRRRALVQAAREVGPACLMTSLTTIGAFASFTTSDLETFQRFGSISALGVLACLILTFTVLPLLVHEAPASPSLHGRWDQAMVRILHLLGRRRWTVLGGSLITLAFFGYGWIAHLEVRTSWNDFFGEESSIRRWDRFMAEHLRNSETIEVQLGLPADAILEAPSTLDVLREVESRLEGVDGITGVQSILDRIDRARSLIQESGSSPHTVAGAEVLEVLTLGHPEEVRRWVSLDGSRVRLSAATEPFSSESSAELLERASRTLERSLPAGWSVALSGAATANARWVRDIQATQLRSFPIALLVAYALLALHLRSGTLALAALLPTLLPVVVTLGTMGWLGMGLDIGRSMIAAVLIGVGVDDAVHLLSHYAARRRAGEAPAASMQAALRLSGRAIVTTSLSLSIGFLTLMASAWETVSSFGLFIAVALLGALAATLVVLPSLLLVVDARIPEPEIVPDGLGFERR